MDTTTLQSSADVSPPAQVAPERARTSINRFGPRWTNWLRMYLSGSPSKRRLAYGALQIARIRAWEKDFGKLTDKEILARGYKLKGRARGGESLDDILPEVFGLVSEAAWRN